MQNQVTQTDTLYKRMYGVVSTDGDFRSPNPHSYRCFVLTGRAPTMNAWYGYTGSIESSPSGGGSPSPGLVPYELSVVGSETQVHSADLAALRDRVLEKMYERLRGNSEIIVDLAEGAQTIRMLRSALKLKKTMADFVVKSLKGRRQSISELSGKWLEYRYGWMPLVYSIYDAADTLGRRIRNKEIILHERASEKRDDSFSYSAGSTVDSRVSYSWDWQHSTRMELGYRFDPIDPTLQALANWTSLNPLSIAWELTPLSFVADWFVNVGDQLRAWENHTIFDTSFRGGYETVSVREVRSGLLAKGGQRPPEYNSEGGLVPKFYGSSEDYGGRSTFVKFDRTFVPMLPRPCGLRVKFDLNAKRFVDAAALTSKQWSRLF